MPRQRQSSKSSRQSSSQSDSQSSRSSPRSIQHILQQAEENPETLSSNDIMQIQRTIGNQATQQLLNRKPKPQSDIDGDADPNAIQRAVGFEFQTNWGVIEKEEGRGLFGRTTRKPFPKGTVLHDYNAFKMTADEASTELGAEIEWVVDPPIPETVTPQVVDQMMQNLENVVAPLVAAQGQNQFTLDQVTNDPRHATIEVQPNIKGNDNAQNMKSNPQVTGGIRLDQMETLFEQLGDPTKADDEHQAILGQLTGMYGSGVYAGAAAAVSGIQGSDKLRGLATQIVSYLKSGSDPLLAMGMAASAGRAFDYAKLIGKLMARTDLGSQFLMLDQNERQPFEQNPDTFVTLILNAAGMAGTEDTHVFERGVKNKAGDANQGMFTFPVSRKDWLIGITEGKDRLSSHHMPQWKSELEGLGALGDKTDTVGNNQQGVIAEFRGVQQQMPYLAWRPFAVDVFKYLVQLNASQSPQEERAALFAELPGGF